MLVGGGSIRFGEADKALANVGGRTMIKRAIDVVEAATNGLPIVAVRTAEQREHYKTALSDRDVRFTVDDLEFERPLVDVLGAIDAIDDPCSYARAAAATIGGCDRVAR